MELEHSIEVGRGTKPHLSDQARHAIRRALYRVNRVLRDKSLPNDDATLWKAIKVSLSPSVVAVAGLADVSDGERAMELLRLAGFGPAGLTSGALDTEAHPVLEAGADPEAEALDSPLASLLESRALDEQADDEPRPKSPRSLVSPSDLEAARLRLPFAPPAPSPSPSLLPSAPGSASPGQGGGQGEGGGGGGEK